MRSSEAFEGHDDGVLAATSTTLRGRTVVATSSVDGTVRLWDCALDSRSELTDRHEGAVLAAVWGESDGQPVVISGGIDSTVRIWHAVTGDPVRVLEGHTRGVMAVATGEFDGRPTVISSSADGSVRVWDTASGDCLRLWKGMSSRYMVSGMLDGRTAVATTTRSRTESFVPVWDPEDGGFHRVLKHHVTWITALAWGECDSRPLLASGLANGHICIWDLASGERVNVLTQHTEQIHDLAWGELDSRPVLISASADGTISLSDALTGDLQSSIAVAAETITSVNVNGHTLLVASSTSETRIIDVTRERVLSRIPHSGTPAAKGSAVALATGGKHGLQPGLALLDLSAYRDSAQ